MTKCKPHHVTTIAGPQAESLLQVLRQSDGFNLEYKDESVPGLAVVKVFTDD